MIYLKPGGVLQKFPVPMPADLRMRVPGSRAVELDGLVHYNLGAGHHTSLINGRGYYRGENSIVIHRIDMKIYKKY